MASSLDFVEYVCTRLGAAGLISYKKMFGEYGIYCNGKIIGLICDNMLFIKKTQAGALVIKGIEEAPPYKGAKPYFVVDIDGDKDLLLKFIKATYDELPAQKPKKAKRA